MSSVVSMPATAVVQRNADRDWISFSATNRFAFVSAGGTGVPEFFEEFSERGDGPPLHRHPWSSWELVLDGLIRFQIDDDEYTVSAGDTVYIPAGMTHSYVVQSDTAHVVGIGLSEGRFEALQREAAPLFMAAGGPDMARVGELADAAGLEVLGPPLQPGHA